MSEISKMKYILKDRQGNDYFQPNFDEMINQTESLKQTVVDLQQRIEELEGGYARIESRLNEFLQK